MYSSSPASKGRVVSTPTSQGQAPPDQRGHQKLEHESLLAKQPETLLSDEDKSNSCAVIQKNSISFFFKITCFNKVDTLCQLNHLIICKNDESKQ